MATKKKVERMPYTPKAVKATFTNQTIRLAVVSNKRLKRAALKRRMSFNAWAVQTLIEAADVVLNPTAPPAETAAAVTGAQK